LVRKLVDGRRGSDVESDAGPGVLFSSGLVAGGSIMGLVSVGLAAPGVEWLAGALGFGNQALPALLGFVAFLGVAYLLYRVALKAPPVPPTTHIEGAAAKR
jgi:hypothetical protein